VNGVVAGILFEEIEFAQVGLGFARPRNGVPDLVLSLERSGVSFSSKHEARRVASRNA